MERVYENIKKDKEGKEREFKRRKWDEDGMRKEGI